MKTKNLKRGLIALCLLMLSACAAAPPSQVPPVINLGCNKVTACTLPANQLKTNEDQDRDNTNMLAAWASCAAQIDMIIKCQEREHE
ncbi:MAG: Rz1-like lysis system protein LysC [Candidatus Oceanisphaera merdipullorum]|nr:Rz1-like lysis system protein LysC [Candidatus Oceanisphaera merdipullorum]